MLALYAVLSELEPFETMSELLHDINPYYKPPLKNYLVKDKDIVLACVKERYAAYDIDETDGVRVNGEDRWFLLRPSNTEPKLRCYLEAPDTARGEQLQDELESLINE